MLQFLTDISQAAAGVRGNRKYKLGFIYLTLCFVLALTALILDRNLLGVAAIMGGMATGLTGVVWGHVKEGEQSQRPPNGNGSA
jgi:hypothetical protein